MNLLSYFHADNPCDEQQMTSYRVQITQCAKRVSDSSGLLDFAIGLVNFVLNLPDRQVKFFGELKLQKNRNQCSSNGKL